MSFAKKDLYCNKKSFAVSSQPAKFITIRHDSPLLPADHVGLGPAGGDGARGPARHGGAGPAPRICHKL
jgi:hypothetical protein